MSAGGTRHGTVVTFDQHRGLGEVVEAGTGMHHQFHCIELADGTRDIERGVPVTFEVRLKLGSPEAQRVTRC